MEEAIGNQGSVKERLKAMALRSESSRDARARIVPFHEQLQKRNDETSPKLESSLHPRSGILEENPFSKDP